MSGREDRDNQSQGADYRLNFFHCVSPSERVFNGLMAAAESQVPLTSPPQHLDSLANSRQFNGYATGEPQNRRA